MSLDLSELLRDVDVEAVPVQLPSTTKLLEEPVTSLTTERLEEPVVSQPVTSSKKVMRPPDYSTVKNPNSTVSPSMVRDLRSSAKQPVEVDPLKLIQGRSVPTQGVPTSAVNPEPGEELLEEVDPLTLKFAQSEAEMMDPEKRKVRLANIRRIKAFRDNKILKKRFDKSCIPADFELLPNEDLLEIISDIKEDLGAHADSSMLSMVARHMPLATEKVFNHFHPLGLELNGYAEDVAKDEDYQAAVEEIIIDNASDAIAGPWSRLAKQHIVLIGNHMKAASQAPTVDVDLQQAHKRRGIEE